MFFKLSTTVTLVGITFLAMSCAHYPDVRPGANGVNRVVVRGQEKEDAERDAISQAQDYCDKFKKQPAFIEEKTQYTGDMKESTRSTVKKASTAAMVLGGTGVALGSGAVETGGAVLGAAGTAGHIMTDGNDYVADMRFKCQ